jgi:hypothetical protein
MQTAVSMPAEHILHEKYAFDPGFVISVTLCGSLIHKSRRDSMPTSPIGSVDATFMRCVARAPLVFLDSGDSDHHPVCRFAELLSLGFTRLPMIQSNCAERWP